MWSTTLETLETVSKLKGHGLGFNKQYVLQKICAPPPQISLKTSMYASLRIFCITFIVQLHKHLNYAHMLSVACAHLAVTLIFFITFMKQLRTKCIYTLCKQNNCSYRFHFTTITKRGGKFFFTKPPCGNARVNHLVILKVSKVS